MVNIIVRLETRRSSAKESGQKKKDKGYLRLVEGQACLLDCIA